MSHSTASCSSGDEGDDEVTFSNEHREDSINRCNKTRKEMDWTVRPFIRSNTQSEPEECCHSDDEYSEGDEVECLKCCTEYYYSSKRCSVEGLDKCRDGLCERPDKDINSGISDSDSDTDNNSNSNANQRQTLTSELAEGFRLIFYVFLPMIARQVGSIFSRRILGRFFGRHPI